MQADTTAAVTPRRILRHTSAGQRALVRALGSETAARVRPTKEATGGGPTRCCAEPTATASAQRADRQEGRQVRGNDHERACRMRRRADGVRASARVVALQQHAAGGGAPGPSPVTAAGSASRMRTPSPSARVCTAMSVCKCRSGE